MSDITIHVQEKNGSVTHLTAPTDMGLSLMEFLKGSGYDILATCGGMALCATCHVCVLSGFEKLKPASDEEYAMLDTLPSLTDTSRLSCQIRLNASIDGITVKLCAEN